MKIVLVIEFIYFLETGEGREKERERNINTRENIDPWPLVRDPTGDRTCNPGMCLTRN